MWKHGASCLLPRHCSRCSVLSSACRRVFVNQGTRRPWEVTNADLGPATRPQKVVCAALMDRPQEGAPLWVQRRFRDMVPNLFTLLLSILTY